MDNAPSAPAPQTAIDPDNGWTVLAYDRRAWMVLGGIAAAGALVGAALARDVHRSPYVLLVLMAAMADAWRRRDPLPAGEAAAPADDAGARPNPA